MRYLKMVFCLKIKRRVDNIYGRKLEEVAESAAYTYAVGFRPEMENKMKFRNVVERRLSRSGSCNCRS